MPVIFAKKTFSQKSHMERHQLIHSGQRPYVCEKHSLKSLTYIITSLYIVANVHMPVMFVKKTFSLKSNMQTHQLIHSGQRLYACNVCKKTFSCKSHVKSHQLVHSGQRSYACNVCEKTFSHKSNMKKHQLIHSG